MHCGGSRLHRTQIPSFCSSCPFDRLTIYDGPDNLAEKIGTYCGQMRNLVVFSTGDSLYVTFHTLKRTAQVFNRGFYGVYDFSDDYVKLGKKCRVLLLTN